MSLRRGRLLVMGLLAIAFGCHAVEPQRRPIDELVDRALADVHARAQQTPRRHAAGAQPPIADRRAATHGPESPTGGPAVAEAPKKVLAPIQHTGAVTTGPTVPTAATRLVSEIFQETDVREAIQALAAQAQISVVVDEQVAGLTSAVIEDEPFETALRKILLPLRCVHSWRDGQCIVGIGEPDSALFSMISERFDYSPLHLSPDELAASVPERYRKYLRLVDKRNRVLIEAPVESAVQILHELERADQPVPQVVLEAMVCVVSPEARLRIGLDFEHRATVGSTVLNSFSLQQLALGGTITPVALGDMFSDFAVTSYFLQLLAQEGYVKIRATPRVMAKDGEKAQITIARETFFSIQPQAEILFRQDIERVEAGITLDIRPVVRGDTITVQIERAEVSEDIRRADGVELNNQFPVINRRWVSTTVHVKDGQTIVIGGLTQNQVVDRVSRVPYLSDIPFIGWVFTRIEKEEQEAEVVIFLSPQIVGAPPVAPLHAPEVIGPPALPPIPAEPLPPPVDGPFIEPLPLGATTPLALQDSSAGRKAGNAIEAPKARGPVVPLTSGSAASKAAHALDVPARGWSAAAPAGARSRGAP